MREFPIQHEFQLDLKMDASKYNVKINIDDRIFLFQKCVEIMVLKKEEERGFLFNWLLNKQHVCV